MPHFIVQAIVPKEALFALPDIVLTSSEVTHVALGDHIEILDQRAATGTTYHPLKTTVTVTRIDGKYIVANPALFYTLASDEIRCGDIGKLVTN